MTQVSKALERLRPWLPLRENASFSGAFDAIYSGAHADVVTLWQDASSREQKFEEQKQSLDEEWGAQAKDSQRRSFAVMLEDTHRAQRERDAAVARAERAEKRHTWPKTTPTGHTYVEPRTYEALCHEHDNAAQADVECWEAEECPPEPTWEMVGIAHREVERLQRELRDLKKKPSEFVPHFKLHGDGWVTPQQDDTVLWSTGPRPEPLALAVTEGAVEEVEVTQEPSSWRAGETGVPISWNLDKLREMRDAALTEWIEVEAIIREAEKREKEEAPIRKLISEIQDVLYPNRNDISADEARLVERLARYLVEKEQS